MRQAIRILMLFFGVLFIGGTVYGEENLVKNPGFEDALKGWGAGWRNDLVEPAVDNTVMHGPGTGSLVLRGEAGKAGGWVQQDIRDLPKGHKKFKASVWVKMKNFALGWQGIVTIEYIGENGKWLGITTLATPWDQSAGDVDWRKLEKEFEIKEGTELLRIGLVIRKSAGWDAKGAPYTGTIWYDDINLAPVYNNASRVKADGTKKSEAVVAPSAGLQIEDPARDHVEFPGVFGLLAPGQEAPFIIRLADQLGQERRLQVAVTVRDFEDKVTFSKNDQLLLKPSSSYEYRLTIPGQETQGFFGVNMVFKEKGVPLAAKTYSFCVVKEAQKRDPFFGISCFGPSGPERCRAMNAGSIGFVMHWMWAEEKKGVFDFSRLDERISKWQKEGLNVVGMFYSPFDGRQFNIPNWLYKEVMEWRKSNKEPFPEYYYDAWSKFVKETVKRYKSSIKAWNITGEYDGLPYLWGTSERVSSFDHFVKITRAIAAAAKEADPDCTVGGVGVSGVDSQNDLVVAEKYWQKTGDVLDGISFNPYVSPNIFGPGSLPIGEERGGLRSILHRARDIAAACGKKKLSIDEKGYMIDSNLAVDSPYAKDMAKVAARGFVVAKSVPEVSHYLYFMVYSTWEPDPPLRTDFYMWKKEGPRPVVASYAAVARLLADAVEPVEVSIHKDILIYVFRQGNKSVAALWTVLKEPVSLLAYLPAAVESYDVMGNRTAVINSGRRELLLTDSPIYLSSTARPCDLAAALQKGKFALPLIKAEAVISDARTLDIHIANQTDREIKARVEPAPMNGINWRSAAQGDLSIPAKGKGVLSLRPERGNILALSGQEFSSVITVEGRTTVLEKHLAPYQVFRLHSRVNVDGNLQEYKHLRPIVLDNTENIYPSGVDIAGRLWMGPEDLSMKVWLTYDDSHLYFAAEVTDDVHVQDNTGTGIWAGDGFAVAIDARNDALSSEVSGESGYGDDDYDFGIALTREGPQSYMWFAAAENEKIKGDTTALFKPAVVQSCPGKWNYELAIPWNCLKPLAGKPGSALGCNFAYMDVDVPKGGWSYWMALTRGIIGGKDPAMFKTFILE